MSLKLIHGLLFSFVAIVAVFIGAADWVFAKLLGALGILWGVSPQNGKRENGL